MFVKFKSGPRAGEIAEMKFNDAQALLADGRAEKYPADAPPSPPDALNPGRLVRDFGLASPLISQTKRKGKKR